jgi:selT/selW/selH-like putative selenoprotein
LADELQQAFGMEPELVAGSNGIFDVIVNDKLLFSKFEAGRFPNPGEVVQKLKE